MNVKEFASKLNGRQYRSEITEEEERQAEVNRLVTIKYTQIKQKYKRG